jgi:serine/threonine-protein kinase
MTASTRSAYARSAVEPLPPTHVELPAGALVGRYQVGEEIGRGSYAVVYRAIDRSLNREVALKTMPCAAHDLLLNEARLLCRIQHHHVVTLHDVVSHDGVEALVLELVAGSSLSAVVRRGRLDGDTVVALGAQLAAGLAALHAAGVIHRDIKPANLRLTADDELKILDLGVGCRVTSDGSRDTCTRARAAGTIPYMSPERLKGHGGDARSDLWSAGAVLFELATGRRVADGRSGTVPYPLADIVARLLAPDPDRRYQSALELLDDLSHVRTAVDPQTIGLSMAAVA